MIYLVICLVISVIINAVVVYKAIFNKRTPYEVLKSRSEAMDIELTHLTRIYKKLEKKRDEAKKKNNGIVSVDDLDRAMRGL